MTGLPGKQRFILIVLGVAVVVGATLPAFLTASCFTQQNTPAELKALEILRSQTRRGQLPADDVVARMEAEFPRTKAAGLARLVRARIKVRATDYAGAATLLDTNVIEEYTSLGDHGLFMRGNALEQTGQSALARTVYEQLIRNYPSSIRVRESTLRVADILLKSGQGAAVPVLLKELTSKDDATALLLAAKASTQSGDNARALASYRRIYFFAPASSESTQAQSLIPQLSSTLAPLNEAEAIARAERLFDARRYNDAYQAYTDALLKFPTLANTPNQLRRGIAAANAKRTEAASVLSNIPSSAAETRAEALFYLTQTYARTRQWEQVRSTVDELRRAFPNSVFLPRALVSAGQIAADAKNDADATYFLRAAVNAAPGSIEVVQAQFDLAWRAHEARNFLESAKLLTEHLAYYVDKNNDNRGRAGYWAARDSERAGKLAEARALYQAVLGRYDANWYGYLAKQRLSAMKGNTQQSFPPDSVVGRAIANLQTVTVAEETAGPAEESRIVKAAQLNNVGLDEWAFEELAQAAAAGPNSPKVNLAIAQIYRYQEDNVRALNTLKKSFPDYSQMKPEEMTRAEWDVFYPLAYWDIIVQESRARNLDPYQVAGLIRQETVFDPRAKSAARAYGLMQVLVPTATLTAKKYSVDRSITVDSLFEPRLNIQLGTAYLRDQIDKFGRIEYVAAAYNAGPGRAVSWRTSLPLEIDEWAEAVPFKETRGYVQGVVRNRLQYERLYDMNGNFRPEVGTKAITAQPSGSPSGDSSVRKRRVIGDEEEE
ncbi:MAG TPA: transglycosylase SLT domain-containing protein [Pyrinomonadaceae bacterium]|nr:transglycosylase SLT domain-containing protein [Pyrinomonadaceae bacterium]